MGRRGSLVGVSYKVEQGLRAEAPGKENPDDRGLNGLVFRVRLPSLGVFMNTLRGSMLSRDTAEETQSVAVTLTHAHDPSQPLENLFPYVLLFAPSNDLD